MLKRSGSAIESQILGGRGANPFLLEFYRDSFGNSIVPSEHVGVIYSSIRSGLVLTDQAILAISEPEGDAAGKLLDVEITVIRGDRAEQEVVFAGQIEAKSEIKLGPYVEDVDIDAPESIVIVGGREEVSMVAPAPACIVCRKLIIDATSLTVLGQRDAASVAYLEASEIESNVIGPPRVPAPALLEVNWPDANAYPWTAHFGSEQFGKGAFDGDIADARDMEEIYRRLRKFVVAFRRHGRERLGRLLGRLNILG